MLIAAEVIGDIRKSPLTIEQLAEKYDLPIALVRIFRTLTDEEILAGKHRDIVF